LFASNIKREVCGVLDFLNLFLKKKWRRKNSQHVFDVRP
jgi:hypothetical protein